jgi:type I site-specific restriction endonuclease
MIFNANTKTNLAIYNLFKDNDINAKMYDSVNSNNKERKPIIEWFKNERDAVLLNVGCFTKGFDVSDVECIILARPTASLSTFIQIAGRGARITNNIFKDRFIFIDGGGNSDRLGMWSDKDRDWSKIFFEGVKPPKQLKEQLDDITECVECEITILKSDVNCPVCKALQEQVIEQEEEEDEEDLIVQNKIKAIKRKTIYPKGNKIVAYVNSINENINFAFRILINQTFDLFVNYEISKGNFENTLNNGVFKKRINKIMGEPFIHLINNLLSKSNRTLQYLITKLITKLNNYYDKI